MADDDTMIAMNDDMHRRCSAVIRYVEIMMRGGAEPLVHPPEGPTCVHVRITGPAEDYEGTSECSGNAYYYDDMPGMVYPAVVVYRELKCGILTRKWRDGIPIYVEEINDRDLTVGQRYSGDVVGVYKGQGLVEVQLAGGAGTTDLHRLRATGESDDSLGVLVWRVTALVRDGEDWNPDPAFPNSFVFVPGKWPLANGDELYAKLTAGSLFEAVARIECPLADVGEPGYGPSETVDVNGGTITSCFECKSDFVEAKFDPDTGGIVYRRRQFAWPYKLRTSVGEWQADFPPPVFDT